MNVAENAIAEPHQPLIRDIMTDDPVCVRPHASVIEAAVLMSQRNIGAVVVCREDEIVGILTERDLLRAAARGFRPESMAVVDLMTASPATISTEATWTAAVDLMTQKGVRHLPVVSQGRTVGMLSLRDLMQHHNRYLEGLVRARTAELESKNAELEERERLMQWHLDVASRIQRQLLPATLPELPAFGLALAYHPLNQVSGDYYDFAMLPSGRLGILVADATGHSIPAAFVSVMAKTAFHAYGQGIESPAAVLYTMNDRLGDLMGAEQFLTMFYGVLDRHSRRLNYALAGHPRPLWYRRENGNVERLTADGPAIGIFPKAIFEERSVKLGVGDLVLIYTDGVTECRNEQQAQFGQQRLHAFLATHGSSADVVSKLDTELAQFRGPEPFHDDVTCIGLRVQG